ncbi:MAG: hypothetical protein IJY61_08805 [Candidatus Gastranaerophilales bacterium]|nr:hypothetical protein [Candidatus Gastranaerophilales bacterium]
MGFKLNLHPNKVKEVAKRTAKDIDIESLQKSLLQKNSSQIDFASQFQKLFDDISNSISKEFFNSQYKETPTVKRLKDLQSQVSKAKTSDELASIKAQFEALISQTNAEKSFNSARQIGINSLIQKK